MHLEKKSTILFPEASNKGEQTAKDPSAELAEKIMTQFFHRGISKSLNAMTLIKTFLQRCFWSVREVPGAAKELKVTELGARNGPQEK